MKKIFIYILSGVAGGVVAALIITTQLSNTNKSETYVYPRNYNQAEFVKSSSEGVTGIDFTNAAENSVHAVVHVKVRSQISAYETPFDYFFERLNSPKKITPVVSSGSGVIISSDGYIVTNNHVINGADILEVTLNDKRTFEAEVIGTDPATDIALIKIKSDDLPFLKWGDSDKLRLGEWVLAVGNPFNLSTTVTAGIVSAKSRSLNIINNRAAIESFIQTDAAVNPGNSGGALVNTEGDLVGINTAIASPTGSFSGYSFAVPQKIAQKIVSDLLEYGKVQRAFIGVSITELTNELAEESGSSNNRGVYVSAISPGGAAEDAGIKPGDIIIRIGQTNVNSTSELQEQVGRYRPGDQVTVVIKRDDKTEELVLTLRNIEGNTKIRKKGDTSGTIIFGATFDEVPSVLLNKLRIKGGVQVTGVDEGKFKNAGIKKDFIITSVNRHKVYKVDDIKLILNNSTGGIYIEGLYPNGISAYYAFGI